MKNISLYFILFIIYSIIGWSIEVIRIFIKENKFVNRGFLLGSYCPIYGISALIMLYYLNNYKDNILTIFILAVVISSIIEYIISYIMEKLFKARWWDYTNRKFNLNGRICLENAIYFGLLGIILIYIINPILLFILKKINQNILIILSIILVIIFIIDFIISIDVTYKLKNSIIKINKDNTEEINKKVKELIESKILNRRIFKAFPKFKINILKIKRR